MSLSKYNSEDLSSSQLDERYSGYRRGAKRRGKGQRRGDSRSDKSEQGTSSETGSLSGGSHRGSDRDLTSPSPRNTSPHGKDLGNNSSWENASNGR